MATNVFSDSLNDFYGAQVGAYTTITQVEIDKQTYNVKACIRNMMIKMLGRSGIVQHGSNKPMTFNLSDSLKALYGMDTIDLICKFSKPNKDEMDSYQKDVEIFKGRWFKKARRDRIKEMIDISTEKLKEDLYQAFGFETESSSEP